MLVLEYLYFEVFFIFEYQTQNRKGFRISACWQLAHIRTLDGGIRRFEDDFVFATNFGGVGDDGGGPARRCIQQRGNAETPDGLADLVLGWVCLETSVKSSKALFDALSAKVLRDPSLRAWAQHCSACQLRLISTSSSCDFVRFCVILYDLV